MKTKEPRFGGGLIADNSRPQNSGKVDLHGVFTIMYAWGYPALRAWSTVITLFDLPRKQTTLHVGIKKKGTSHIDTIATADINDQNQGNAHIINFELGYRFESEGDYEVVCSLKDHKTKLKIPLRLNTRPWPTFSKKEIDVLEKNKSLIPHKVSAQVKCKNCSHSYLFEEKILESEEHSGGTIPFPESGIYECDNCGHNMKLKDIQGQIRASIKDNLSNFLKSNKDV